MTSEVPDKDPVNCKKVDICPRIRSILDRDLLPFQYREAALAVCAKCDEFEDRRKQHA